MCVTLNPWIKIAPIRAPSGLISYLLKNRAKNTPRAALWGERRRANVKHKFPSISHKQERCCCSSLPPPPKKPPPNPDKFVYLSLGTKSDPFLDPSTPPRQSHQPRVLLRSGTFRQQIRKTFHPLLSFLPFPGSHRHLVNKNY